MATKMMRSGAAAPTRTIPVRKISNDDLRLSLAQGMNDFLAMRGDEEFLVNPHDQLGQGV